MSETIYKGKDGPSNAAKAARKSLGADAKRGLDFDVVKVADGAVWRVRALDKTAANDTDLAHAVALTGVAEDLPAKPLIDGHGSAKPARKPHPSDPPANAAAYASADHFRTHLRLGPSELIQDEHATLAAAAARAHLLRVQHPGRDVLVYAVSKQFPGGDIPVPRSAQQEAAAASINATATTKPKETKVKTQTNGPLGKRAQIEADAKAGKMPKPPNFEADTHERFRPKLKEVVALVKEGNIKGLRAYKINPVSSSPKAIDRYRQLAIMALEAKR